LLGHHEGFFTRRPLVLSDISAAVVERATTLRALHGFKTPDAIHVAPPSKSTLTRFLLAMQRWLVARIFA